MPRTEIHTTPRFPRGFRCASRNVGLKPDAPDLAFFVSDVDAAAAAVFTRSHFPGAPVILGRETIKAGRLRGIVANSKYSNVATGEAGMRSARRMAEAAAREIGATADRILVSSTGVIGIPLPIEKIERGIRGIAAELRDDPMIGARGIMTTDTYPKALSVGVDDAVITWIAKGSGMIEPNMATMLVYAFTDATLDAATLDRVLRDAVHQSFNMLSVDSDTSTSDTCAILANGLAGHIDHRRFSSAFLDGCIRMTELLARDGEGATRLLRVHVEGAADESDARRVAKSLINSPLIKTMVHGADPNVGRVLMAIGKCFDSTIVQSTTHASINGCDVIRDGTRVDFEDSVVRNAMTAETVEIVVQLGAGAASATGYGCDLSKGYIDENAAYYSS